MKGFEDYKDPKTGKPAGLRHREDQGRFWWELRACDYYAAFLEPKLTYQVIQFHSSYSLDFGGRFGNDKTFFLPTVDRGLATSLNSPLLWWFNWRNLTHLKDEALSPMAYKMEMLPVARFDPAGTAEVTEQVDRVIQCVHSVGMTSAIILDWLRHEFDLDKPGTILSQPHKLDADAFAVAVRKALPKSHKLSVAALARLKQEHERTVEPARSAAAQALALEHRVSDIVNAAFGLTPEEVALMWATAPPRMPF